MVSRGGDRGSPLRIPADDLEGLASMMETLVPGELLDAGPGWSAGWHACCSAIRVVAEANRKAETSPAASDGNPAGEGGVR